MDLTRSIEDVNRTIKLANLQKNDLQPKSQALFFSNNDDKKFILMELNEELVKNLENNEKLTFKGRDEDNVVLCTKDTTFQVLEAETSNSILLVKPQKNQENKSEEETVENLLVSGVFHTYLQPQYEATSLVGLYEILKNSIYKGPEHEDEIIKSNKLYTLEELKQFIQVSDTELMESIKSMDIIEINGFIRELDFEYHSRVLSYMIKLIDENSWSLDRIDFEETCEALKEIVPEPIIEELFKKYTISTRMLDGIQFYRYKETEICQFFARAILRTGQFNLENFMEAWTEMLPEGMNPTEEMLYGVALITEINSTLNIQVFEEANLPDNVQERFEALFSAKEKWTAAEILPYIKKLRKKTSDVNALLAKYTRTFKVNGVVYYSAKHARNK